MKKTLACVMVLGLGLSGCSLFGSDESADKMDAAQAPAAETTTQEAAGNAAQPGDKIQADLEATGRQLVAQAARNVQPSKSAKLVRKMGSTYVATYTEVDTNSMTTNVNVSPTGNYVGFVRYQEVVYECRGKSKSAALSAPCEAVK
ncbi:MAG TPA: translation initiation factor 2, partial [Candidatus Desulfovibrio intestinigallinarum]|nr:translation initiation factor 2 [Candidatus Desulfovibrio intestinigallinarum]